MMSPLRMEAALGLCASAARRRDAYEVDFPSNRWPTSSAGFTPGFGRNFWTRPM